METRCGIAAARFCIQCRMGKRRRLRGREILIVLGVFAAAVLLLIAIFAGVKRSRAAVGFEAEYYFLVERCEDSTAAAVAGSIYGAGGAGYLLHGGGAVVIACYYTVRDAERVQAAMREKGAETQIMELSAEKFYLSGANAAYAARVAANAETAEACARLLYDAANGLERAELGQTEARTAARGAADCLAGLRTGNAGAFFDRWNAELVRAERECREISDGIAFAKDLRRVQARILCGIVELGSYF